MNLVLGFLFVVVTAALDCYKYGPAYHKSEAGKVSISGLEDTCTGSEASYQACIETCSAGVEECYSYYVDSGYGSNGVQGGGSRNYGKSQGGCFSSPVDSGWVGNNCTTEGTRSSDGLYWESRQYCCTVDKCNGQTSSASKVSVMGAILAIFYQVVS
mmetsp:Transcript_15195/g.31825  ORF Transcript_15195/g.31825 Transcript_15195/m.31825 type:complete len:157 (+) Transcript_15195:89-559(+)